MRKRNFGVLLLALIIMPVFALPNAYATTVSKEQIDAFRSAKTVRIVVNQSYDEAEGVSLPFEDTAKRFLEYAGLMVVADTEDYDLMVKIKAKGKARGADYSPGGWLYTGASLSGTISLETQGVPAYRKTFLGRIPTPSSTYERKRSPADAPFRGAFNDQGSFVSNIAEVIEEVYGADALISALKNKSSYVRISAAEALGGLKDPRAVEPLIAALNDEHWDVRKRAVEALVKTKDPRAVEPLIAALKDNLGLRISAAEALGGAKRPTGC